MDVHIFIDGHLDDLKHLKQCLNKKLSFEGLIDATSIPNQHYFIYYCSLDPLTNINYITINNEDVLFIYYIIWFAF